ncbi:hypothetical protein [Nocardia jiangxiensis]|uniref:hypothetical protein n=1 Tax=Nocardia jiangxiensis TaxID=282685 RepID=UPI0002D475C0|nr:hypothetical protein [Nocardia jiangxiensis]
MTAPMLRLLSLGAGVQSTVLALMACRGELPGLDGAIFADTGWEPQSVYAQVDRLEAELSAAGIPLYRVSKGNLRGDALDPEHRFVSVPYYTHSAAGEDGMARRQCTSEYKLVPINRKVRELLGAKAPTFRTVPKGRVAEQWIGFSTDEMHRVNDRRQNRYTLKRFPLLELGMSRKDCERWLKVLGWGHTVKSSCIGCPFHGNAHWRDMRDNHPDEWADACDFDRRIRKGNAGAAPIRGEAFLHRSRVPLELAPIDRVTRREHADLQLEIFDEFAEQGDLDGCSPYGCRSGQPISPSTERTAA